MKRFYDARDVFFERRFGMFIHWGLYAIDAWQEQILWRGRAKRRDYEKNIHLFNPVNFDPDAIIDLARRSGMQYICMTTKHHDGFCMFDTRYTDYSVMHTPYGRDTLKMLSDACARRGMPLSLYYSLPDWHHPNYPNYGRHHEMFGARAGDEPDEGKYLQYVRNQITELLSNYGPIYQLFWDVNVARFDDPSLNDLARELQPGILINDRGPGPGDYNTPERHLPEGGAFETPTEACQAIGYDSWGYRAQEDYHTAKHLMQSVDKILAMGGNYLLNVGPCADGSIGREYVERLNRIGDWYHRVRESFEGTYPASELIDRRDMLLTKRNHTVYAHLWQEPTYTAALLKPLDRVPTRVTLLNDGRQLEALVDITPRAYKDRPMLRIRGLPVEEFSNEVLVIKMEFSPEESA